MVDSPGRPEPNLTQQSVDDEWDAHWQSFGAAAEDNPANRYRHRLILDRLRIRSGDCLLDIGSGQGEFAVLVASCHPELTVRGIEYSASGVERSRQRAAGSRVSATFEQRDLLLPSEPRTGERKWASLAVCSEVLEHVDEPARLLRHAKEYLKPGCRLVITVPGGPRSAFDKHIGHRRHFDVRRLRQLLADVELEHIHVDRAGFPFFNLYRLAVIIRGRKLIADLNQPISTLTEAPRTRFWQQRTMRFFDFLFRWNLDRSPFGWQLVATAVVKLS
jgi:SAM-dependent methyltransferase